MKDLLLFITGNKKTLVVAYIVSSIFLIGFLIYKVNSHECKKTIIQINEETRKKLNQIDDAKTRNDIDSLLRELYGFESVD